MHWNKQYGIFLMDYHGLSIKDGRACSFCSPSCSPKMDFWGIRLPLKKKSTQRQAILSGIIIGFRAVIVWGNRQIEDMNGDSSILSFDFNDTHFVQ